MSTTFTVFLIIAGLFTATCIWALNLKILRYAKNARWGSMVGILVLFIMILYSTDYVKDANYSHTMVIGLSLGMTIVWVLACTLLMGLFIILVVGLHWMITMFRNHSFQDLWNMMKSDFAESYAKFKAWLEGED